MITRATDPTDEDEDSWTAFCRELDEEIAAYLDTLPARDREPIRRVLDAYTALLGELDARVAELERGRVP
jgi:hypothetical protein